MSAMSATGPGSRSRRQTPVTRSRLTATCARGLASSTRMATRWAKMIRKERGHLKLYRFSGAETDWVAADQFVGEPMSSTWMAKMPELIEVVHAWSKRLRSAVRALSVASSKT